MNIYQRINEVRKEVEYVQKDASVSAGGGGYKAVTHDMVTAVLRKSLVKHGIVRQVNFDREPSRFCPNLAEHGHFHDEVNGSIHDVTFKPGIDLSEVLDLPEGTVITDIELTLRGKLPSGKS